MLQVSYDHILFFCGTRCVNKGEGKQNKKQKKKQQIKCPFTTHPKAPLNSIKLFTKGIKPTER